MRRAILFLLALALLLSGCVRKQEQPSLAELLRLEELASLAAPPEETPVPQTAGDPLPSTGVWVDESVYTPRKTAEAIYTRPEGDLSRYVPGQGPVYPYCAGENQFGFCTAEGVLVTDPIYEQIGTLYDVYDYDSHSDPLVYGVMPHPSGQDDRPMRGAVAADGSFAIACDYESVYHSGGDIKCTRGETEEEYDLYDRQGRLLLSAKGLDYTFSADMPEDRNGDRFQVYAYNDSSPEEYYVSAGSPRLGPYFYAAPFSEGLACVSEDGHSFGYIDETGDWVITPRYNRTFSNGQQFRNGRAIQNTDDGDVLIDRAGNILLASHSNCMSRSGDVFRVYNDGTLGFYDRDGGELYSLEGGWDTLSDDLIFCADENGCTIRSLSDPELEAQFPNGYPTPGAIYVDGRFLKGFVLDDHEHAVRYWVSEDLRHTGHAPLPAYVEGYWWGESIALFRRACAENTLTDLMTGETYYPVFEQSRVLIFTGDGELLWTCSPNDHLAIIGGRLGVVTDRDCTYYEQDGSVSFRFPFFVLPDD